MRGLGLLSLHSHHHLLLHALPARRARLHLLVGRQRQRGVVLLLEALVGQRGLERRGVHGGVARGPESEAGGGGGGSGSARAQRLSMAIERVCRLRALHPGSSLSWHWRGPPSVRLDIPPALRHPLLSEARLQGTLRGSGRAGGRARCGALLGFPCSARAPPSPLSTGQETWPLGAALRPVPACEGGVCAQLRHSGGFSLGTRLLS